MVKLEIRSIPSAYRGWLAQHFSCSVVSALISGLLAASMPGTVFAHGFGALYNLPVPFWLYGWGAAAAVIVSFVVAGLFVTAQPSVVNFHSLDISERFFPRLIRRAMPLLRLAAVFLLLLCIATGFLGHRDPIRNFSMTFFWIIFLLLFAYLTAIVGNIYAAVNPWRTLTDTLGHFWRGYSQGRFKYPAWLGDWPAVLLYLCFVWFELFGTGRPKPLATFLTAYTLLNLAGVWLIGSRAWFRHCEFFAKFLRLIALMAPLDYQRVEGGRGVLRLRWPFSGLLQTQPERMSSLVFVLAMLSTTAFDGLKATQWWVMLFWADPTGWLTDWAGGPPSKLIAVVRPWFIAWESFWLFASPLIYLGFFALMMLIAKWLTRSNHSVRYLMLQFGYALLPIALVYNITHYATLVFAHGPKIISLASDPFGRRWDLFGTAVQFRAPFVPDMGVVWHSQVGLILFGHIVSIWLAHLLALRVFESRWQATLSQIPMLILMVGFTVSGLWIIAQPLTVQLMR